MKPLGKRVLCRDITTEERYPGTRIVILADSRAELTKEQAEVVAVGATCEQGLQPGDWVIHRPHARAEGPDGMFWLNEDDVVARLEV